jgi:toxin ParE1/3/4
MGRPLFTSPASRDMHAIVRYIGAKNPAAASRLIGQIEIACQRLADDPLVGQARPDLLPDIRFLPVGNYLIFYKPSLEGVRVIRVIHGARDYGASDLQ